MKGVYKTKDGNKIEVLDFDEENKMVRVESGWVGFPEYSTWEKEGMEEASVKSEQPTSEEVKQDEEPKKIKRTYKKKGSL